MSAEINLLYLSQKRTFKKSLSAETYRQFLAITLWSQSAVTCRQDLAMKKSL